MMNKHLIKDVTINSIAESLGIVPGDFLVSVNNQNIEDIFDYRYICQDTEITIEIQKQDGNSKEYYVNKSDDEDIGIIFESGLMDEYRSCCNKCIFCFIDQLPEGMRDTLYFKDDDMRLSFLQGNYVTLTNMSDNDVDRIIKYKLEPVNISFQTTNPELRCKMLNNRFAGDALEKARKLYDSGIKMNGQIVLCKGINDGSELERSLSDLYEYCPVLESLSIVPVGLTKFRDGLFPLEPFTKEDAVNLIENVKKWQDKAYKEHGIHFVHASDEWYILAEEELPDEETYDGYLQIENGVGMLRSLITEFDETLDDLKDAVEIYDKLSTRGISPKISAKNPFSKLPLSKKLFSKSHDKKVYSQTGIANITAIYDKLKGGREVSIVTGLISCDYIKQLTDKFTNIFSNYKINVYPVRNDFFGENITVTGLLTGQDIISQLKDKNIGDILLLSENMLKADTDILLDDISVEHIEKSLHSRTCIVKSNGRHLIESIIGEKFYV